MAIVWVSEWVVTSRVSEWVKHEEGSWVCYLATRTKPFSSPLYSAMVRTRALQYTSLAWLGAGGSQAAVWLLWIARRQSSAAAIGHMHGAPLSHSHLNLLRRSFAGSEISNLLDWSTFKYTRNCIWFVTLLPRLQRSLAYLGLWLSRPFLDHIRWEPRKKHKGSPLHRDSLKGLYMVVRIFFLLLLNCSAWPCLGPA